MQRLIQLSSDLISQGETSGLEDIEAYMQERDRVFTDLQHLTPASDQVVAFRPLVLRIAEMDAVITSRMTLLRDTALFEIEKINQGKRSKSAYDSPAYGDDSVFFDSKQ